MKLLIIDVDTERINQILSVISQDIECTEKHNNIRDINEIYVSGYDLILLHIGNIRYDRNTISAKPLESSVQIILYSGAGNRIFTEAERASGCIHNIQETIGRGSDMPDNIKQGFRELIDYFKHGAKGNKPSLLFKSQIPYISALSILCVGFAIAHKLNGYEQCIDDKPNNHKTNIELPETWWEPVFGDKSSQNKEVMEELKYLIASTSKNNIEKINALHYVVEALPQIHKIKCDTHPVKSDSDLITNVIDKLKYFV